MTTADRIIFIARVLARVNRMRRRGLISEAQRCRLFMHVLAEYGKENGPAVESGQARGEGNDAPL